MRHYNKSQPITSQDSYHIDQPKSLEVDHSIPTPWDVAVIGFGYSLFLILTILGLFGVLI